MNIWKIIGLIILLAVWVWLCWLIFAGAGFNLRTLFIAAASGIIIFVPLYKKYVAPDIKKRKNQ